MTAKKRFAVFASGEGTNLQAIIDVQKKGELRAELALVFSDKKSANALKRAEAAGIKTLFLHPKDYATPQSYERDIVIHLKEEKIDFIVLAGYMRMLTPFFTREYPNLIMNVHPSLLPAFKGARALKDSFTYGVKVTGVTIHFVDDKIDHGPIILQEAVNLSEQDTVETLEEKIHKVEHRLYPKAINLFADDRLKARGRRVKIQEKK